MGGEIGSRELRGDLEADCADVAGLILTHQAFRVLLDTLFRKNEAMIGGLPGNAFVFMEFQKIGGIAEVVTLLLAAIGLEVAELAEGVLELAGEAGAVESQAGQQRDLGLGIRGWGKQLRFQERDSI
jgi:hypothetical protein